MNNSFQKNPFINNKSNTNFNNKEFSNYTKLGHKTVEQIQEDMNNVKYNNFKNKTFNNSSSELSKNDFNHSTDFKSRINNIRNINRD